MQTIVNDIRRRKRQTQNLLASQFDTNSTSASTIEDEDESSQPLPTTLYKPEFFNSDPSFAILDEHVAMPYQTPGIDCNFNRTKLSTEEIVQWIHGEITNLQDYVEQKKSEQEQEYSEQVKEIHQFWNQFWEKRKEQRRIVRSGNAVLNEHGEIVDASAADDQHRNDENNNNRANRVDDGAANLGGNGNAPHDLHNHNRNHAQEPRVGNGNDQREHRNANEPENNLQPPPRAIPIAAGVFGGAGAMVEEAEVEEERQLRAQEDRQQREMSAIIATHVQQLRNVGVPDENFEVVRIPVSSNAHQQETTPSLTFRRICFAVFAVTISFVCITIQTLPPVLDEEEIASYWERDHLMHDLFDIRDLVAHLSYCGMDRSPRKVKVKTVCVNDVLLFWTLFAHVGFTVMSTSLC